MNRQHVRLIQRSAERVISIDAARQWLREDSDDQNEVITDLINAAEEYVVGATSRALLETIFCDTLDAFPAICTVSPHLPRESISTLSIYLMRSPLLSVDSIKYLDTDGQLQTLAADKYVVDSLTEPGRIHPAIGETWPATAELPASVRVFYTAGYLQTDEIPTQMIQAMRLLIGHWYEHREAVITGTISREIELAVRNLLEQVAVQWSW